MKKCKECGVFKPMTDFYLVKEGQKWTYGECKKCRNEKSRISMLKYSRANKNILAEKNKVWREKNREHIKARNAFWKEEYRMAALRYYSKGTPKCKCCGEEEVKFLCLDHKNNDGHEHRERVGGNVYSWLKQNNYPKGFQVLCYNCNMAKEHYGKCPHKH